MIENPHEINSPCCGRDQEGDFHCKCGKCKPISSNENKIPSLEILELTNAGLPVDVVERLRTIGICTLGDMQLYCKRGNSGAISDSDIFAVTFYMIKYFGDKRFWID